MFVDMVTCMKYFLEHDIPGIGVHQRSSSNFLHIVIQKRELKHFFNEIQTCFHPYNFNKVLLFFCFLLLSFIFGLKVLMLSICVNIFSMIIFISINISFYFDDLFCYRHICTYILCH